MRTEKIELVPRSDGARLRRVTLAVEADGAVSLSTLDTGGDELAVWGQDVEEVTLTVPREAVARLALALAAELLAGGQHSVSKLQDLCDRRSVGCRVASWT